MTPSAQIMELSSSFDNYTRIGWSIVPIAPGGKGPKTKGWQLKENCITEANKIPSGYGAGLAHAYSGTCAIDIDDWDVAVRTLGFVGVDLVALTATKDAVLIHSGNPGHAKLIYKMPFGLTLPSKKCIHTTDEGIKKNWIDFRCATADGKTVQDLLPPSVHPITQQPYQWVGQGHYTNLPFIPPELLAYWRSIITAEEVRNINVDGSVISASWDEIKQALTYISPEVSRDEWVTVLMALHYAGEMTNKSDEALALADEWSAQSATKYKGQRDILNSWQGFKSDKGVTLGSLFHMAGKTGWTRSIPDVSMLFTATKDQVTSPKVFADQIATPKPFVDFDLVPPLLARRAKEVGVSVGCDPLVAVWAGLGAASSVVDARTRLDLMSGWTAKPVLWLMTIGAPSDKKTPAAEPMMSILKKLELEDRDRFAVATKIFSTADAAYASAKKAHLTAASQPEWLLGGSDIAQLPYVPDAPKAPIPKRLVVSDITSQKLVRMCAERPEGLLCHLDEMQSWCEKLTTSTGESRSSWITAYDCTTQAMDRVGNGLNDGSENNIIADNYAVSIYGNMQPKVFKAYVKKLTQDGLMQRFIPAILREEYSDVRNEPMPEALTSAAIYEQHIRLIHALPPTTYRLSHEAYIEFREFQNWFLELKRDERLLNADDSYMTAIGKLEGTCGRLMLFWHLFENPQHIEVSHNTSVKVIEFVKTYVVNALRYMYAEVAGMSIDSIDQFVRDYILQHAGITETVTLSEIRRSARRRIEHLSLYHQDVLVSDVMDELEKANWIKKVGSNGKTTTWAIDSRLANFYPEYRKAVIAAKQRRFDMIHSISKGKAPLRKVKGHEILDDSDYEDVA